MTKITAYTALASAHSDDVLPVVDLHDTTMAATGTTKKVSVAAVLAALGGAVNVLNTAYAGGADPTGAADSTSAFNAAIAALPAGGGTVLVPAGTYKITGTVALAQGQSLIGAGSSCTTINYTGSTTAITVILSGTFTGGVYGGRLSGFYLGGYGAGGSAVGIQVSNLQGTWIEDVAIYGFGGKGLYFLTTSGDWSEQSNVQARLVQNGTAAVFDTSSFDYANFDFTIVTGNGQGGVTLQNNAQFRGCSLRIRGNFYGAVSNTAAVIAIDPGNTSGTSYMQNVLFDVTVESAGSSTGHYSVKFGSSNAASQITGFGILAFITVGPAFQGYSNPGFVPFSFAGIINDPVLGFMTAGTDALASYGRATANGITVHGNGNFASGNPVVFLDDGTQVWQLYDDKTTHSWGVYDQTHSATGLLLTPSTLNLQVVTGNLDIATAGKGLQVAEGSNAKQGTAVLVAGSKVVANTAVTANSRIFLTGNADGGTPGWLRVSARTAGTSFTITSSSGTDTSTVAYQIFEPG